MPNIDSTNFETKDPDDYLFVSAKHYARKVNIEQGQGNETEKLLGKPGPITGLMLSIVDIVTTFSIKFILLLMQISSIAFDWVYTLTMGNINFLPNEASKGIVISMKWFRYFMTVIMPPFGIFLHKGLYGWFSMLVCMIITYINFIAGIIYAFVICMRNRYADQYEDREIRKAMAKNPENITTEKDASALWSMLVFLFIILFLSIY